MKVLWFANTPSLAANIFSKDNYFGGWIASLQKSINEYEDINLAVAFYSNDYKEAKIYQEHVIYYPIKRNIYSLNERYFNKENERSLLDKCVRIVNDFNPNVIHIFGTENVFAGIVSCTKIPVLVHLQGLCWPILQNWLPNEVKLSQVLFNSSSIKLFKGAGVYKSYCRLKNQAIREIKFVKKNHFFSGRTDWDKSYIRLLNPDAEYFHIDEILREPFYNFNWSVPQSNKFLILSILGPNIFKGLDTILKTAFELKNSTNIEFEWNLVGIQKNDEVVKMIEKIFNLKFCSLNVNFLGLKNQFEIIELMKRSYLLINPSHIENSSNSICEAMLAGLPVAAANVGGNNSLIDDRKNGFLYTDNDISQLIKIIYDAANSKQTLSIISENAKKTAHKRHDKTLIAGNTIKIYSRLAALMVQ
jgi:glycosyltransferase involved in cell wall biosynthesis